MTPVAGGRDDGEVEAILVDRYLESLLARRPVDAAALDPALQDAARHLRATLPRFHPSFVFEERLAHRLSAAAAELRWPLAAGGEGLIVPIGRGLSRDPGFVDADRSATTRPVVIGGVLTSAAISLAGAAYVAWRLRRPADPMSRAVRAVGRARIS